MRRNYSYFDWRREDAEYRRLMARIGRSWWMREFGLRRIPGAIQVHQFIRAVTFRQAPLGPRRRET